MAAEASPRAGWDSRFPTVAGLAGRARRRLPAFAWDFLMGGTGDELGPGVNRAALDAIRIVPRYGREIAVDPSVRLFGRAWPLPLAVAPIGMDGAIWPGAPGALADAAEGAGIPCMVSTMSAGSLEEAARRHPGGAWMQLYCLPNEDHRMTLDVAARAERAGMKVLAVTVDIPLPGRRVRDMRNGMKMPFRISPRLVAQAALRPAWLAALAEAGMPRFANFAAYAPAGAAKAEVEAVVRGARPGGGSTWETVARLRQAWPHVLLVKGILHPADARRAVALGADGVIVSNHGGRQFDPAPASIDVLPAIRAALGPGKAVLMDGGILSGADMLRAVAAGADMVLAGRAFMLGLAALGPAGAAHVASVLGAEFRVALGQSGAMDVAGARALDIHHPGRWALEAFGPSLGLAATDRLPKENAG